MTILYTEAYVSTEIYFVKVDKYTDRSNRFNSILIRQTFTSAVNITISRDNKTCTHINRTCIKCTSTIRNYETAIIKTKLKVVTII